MLDNYVKMDLILAHVWNVTGGRHGVIHPACRPCFDETAKRWSKDEVLGFRLDEVTDPEAESHSQYMAGECFYCGGEA